VVAELFLVAGGGCRAPSGPALSCAPAKADAQPGWRLLSPRSPTLSEVFAAHPRDGGWAGFLAAQFDPAKPLLWVQERMAILESGRVHPPGLPSSNLIHVEARDARLALWAMEEGLRCAGLSAVIGELWGDPAALDFTATRRLAVAAERSGVAAFLIRLGGHANLSGARMRWRIASLPSLANPFDARAPGPSAWDAELFRARGMPPGRWSIADEPQTGDTHRVRRLAAAASGALGEEQRRSA
jgi:protein ImuA